MNVRYSSAAPDRQAELEACGAWGGLLARAEAAGVARVEVADFPQEVHRLAGLYSYKPGDSWILLNSAADDLIFTLAHELAHHHLHQGMDYALYDADAGYERQIESEADAWASDLLARIRGGHECEVRRQSPADPQGALITHG